MNVGKCDLCGETRECLQKEIEGREYDICAGCWEPLAAKLSGKGRAHKDRDAVCLPPPAVRREEEIEKPLPGALPKVWFSSEKPN